MFRKIAPVAAAVAALTLAAPQLAEAQPPHCPPGHAKKGWCGGARVETRVYRERAPEREVIVIRDYSRYGLRAPRTGYYYGQVGEEVYLFSRATQDIVEGFGAAAYLLQRYGG